MVELSATKLGAVKPAFIGRSPDLFAAYELSSINPCFIANKLAWARLEAAILV
jgi:hypothetical protein